MEITQVSSFAAGALSEKVFRSFQYVSHLNSSNKPETDIK